MAHTAGTGTHHSLMCIQECPQEVSVRNGKTVRRSLSFSVRSSDVFWNSDFQVTEKLPNVTFDLGRNWAGNIPVGRAGHPNNTLFFWAFEKEEGSLTATADERSDEPWGIFISEYVSLFSLLIVISEFSTPARVFRRCIGSHLT